MLLPVSCKGDVKVIQLALLAADHEHEALEAVTLTLPLPPEYVKLALVEDSVNVDEQLLLVNVAVTPLSDDIATVHWFELVESHPDQLVKVEPESAAAVSTTDVPDVYEAVPVLPLHESVPLDGVTLPEPEPDFVTVRVYELDDDDVNVAVTPLAALIATVHWFELVESHPDQLVKVEPESAVAVSTTDVPDVYDAVPVLPLHESVPLDVYTLPEPVPDLVTVRVYELDDDDVKVAVTFLADDIATVHWFELVESHPDQFVNVEPESAVAVSTTDVPDVYEAVPVLPLHERVPLDGVTVPEPVPDLVMVNV